jgi:hypothetical protein
MERLDETAEMCDDGLTVVRGPAARPEGSEVQLRALTLCATDPDLYLTRTSSGDPARCGWSKKGALLGEQRQ